MTRPLTDQERARALARLGALRGRGGVRVGFHPMGEPVPAKNPEELKEAGEQALVDQTLEQEPS